MHQMTLSLKLLIPVPFRTLLVDSPLSSPPATQDEEFLETKLPSSPIDKTTAAPRPRQNVAAPKRKRDQLDDDWEPSPTQESKRGKLTVPTIGVGRRTRASTHVAINAIGRPMYEQLVAAQWEPEAPTPPMTSAPKAAEAAASQKSLASKAAKATLAPKAATSKPAKASAPKKPATTKRQTKPRLAPVSKVSVRTTTAAVVRRKAAAKAETAKQIAQITAVNTRVNIVKWKRSACKEKGDFKVANAKPPRVSPFCHNTYESKILNFDRSKDEPSGEVAAWAEDRQELMEACSHFYNSSQSGPYTNDLLVYGVYMDRDSGDYSYMDSEIIVTRMGGGAIMTDDGQMAQDKDQTGNDTRYKAFENTMNLGASVMVIVGNRSRDCPVDLEHKFNIIDNYRVTDLFFRYQGGKSVCYVRYEKINLAQRSFLTPKNGPDPPPLEQRHLTFRVEKQSCKQCGRETSRRFTKSWICGNPNCEHFYTNDGKAAPETMSWNAAWLQERSSRENLIQPSYEPVSDLLETLEGVPHDQLAGCSRLLGRGIVCPKCKRCNCRVYFNRWQCATEGCDYVNNLRLPNMSLRTVLKPLAMLPHGHPTQRTKLGLNSASCGIIQKDIKYTATHKQERFVFPDGKSIFAVDRPTGQHNRAPEGTVDLFNRLLASANEGEFELCRGVMKNANVQGQRAAHFSANFGEEYLYDVGNATTPFDRAPTAILDIYKLLADFQKRWVPADEQLMPNELLCIAYLEYNKIGFHDDGEVTLGPTITAVALGAPTLFKVRMKPKYYLGFSASKKPTPDDPVLPGCKFFDIYKPWKDAFDAGKMSSEDHDKLRVNHAKNHKFTKNAPVLLEVPLHHGDLYGMHGYNMQKYYEHGAESPDGAVRFALTLRYVDPKLLAIEKDKVAKRIASKPTQDNGAGVQDEEAEHADNEFGHEEAERMEAE